MLGGVSRPGSGLSDTPPFGGDLHGIAREAGVTGGGLDLTATEKLTDLGGVEIETLSEARRGMTEEDPATVTPLLPVRPRSHPPWAA